MTGVRLERCEWMGDWYSLHPDQGISVEGPSEEWRQVAAALRSGAPRIHFRRCAFAREGARVAFWSPRNSISDRTNILFGLDDVPALADQIEEELAAEALKDLRDIFVPVPELKAAESREEQA